MPKKYIDQFSGSDVAASEFAAIVKVCPIIFEEKL